jgi:hypothetical protein
MSGGTDKNHGIHEFIQLVFQARLKPIFFWTQVRSIMLEPTWSDFHKDHHTKETGDTWKRVPTAWTFTSRPNNRLHYMWFKCFICKGNNIFNNIIFMDYIWFNLRRSMNSQNSPDWTTEKLTQCPQHRCLLCDAMTENCRIHYCMEKQPMLKHVSP